MLLGSRGGRIRCLVVWLVACAAVAGVARVLAAPLTRAWHAPAERGTAPAFDVVLVEVAAVALLGCALWAWAAISAVVVEALRAGPPGALPPRGVPAGLRRVVLAACGVALAGGLAAPSYAGGHHAHPTRAALSGLPLPDRAVTTHHRPPRVVHPFVDPAPNRVVVVRSGDTLWALAAGELPPGSPASAVAARWHAIYAANRLVIGPDPDVIVPGQRLRPPGEDRP